MAAPEKAFVWKEPTPHSFAVRAFTALFIVPLSAASIAGIFGVPLMWFGGYLAGYSPREFSQIADQVWGDMVVGTTVLVTLIGLFFGYFRTIHHKVQFLSDGRLFIQNGNYRRKKRRYPYPKANWRDVITFDTDGRGQMRFVHKDGFFFWIPGRYDSEWTSFLYTQIDKRYKAIKARFRPFNDHDKHLWKMPKRPLIVRLALALAGAGMAGWMAFYIAEPAMQDATSDTMRMIYLAIAGLIVLLSGAFVYMLASTSRRYGVFFFDNGEFNSIEAKRTKIDIRNVRLDDWRDFTKLVQKTDRFGSTRLRFEADDGSFFTLPCRFKKRQAQLADEVKEKIEAAWSKAKGMESTATPSSPEQGGVPSQMEVISATLTATVTRTRYGI